MQFFVGSDSNRNVYADSNGVFQSVCNVNGTSDFFPCYSSSLWPSPTSQVLVNTEVLKQMIYGHEAIFRNQVIELHRLYDKQRELINELKSDFSRESVAHTNQFRLEVGGNAHTGKATDQEVELLDVSRCKKYNNKVLDLQLLATEYMDDEDVTSSLIAEANYGYGSPFSSANGEHNDQQPLAREKGTFVESASTRPILFDLNKPFNFEEPFPTSSHEEMPHLSKNTSGGMDRSVHGSVAVYIDVNTLDDTVQLNCDHEPGLRTTDSDSLNQDSNPSSSVISPVSPILKDRPCNERLGIDDKFKRPSKKRTLKSRKAQRCPTFLKNKTQDTFIRVPKSLKLIPACNKTETQSKNILPPTQSVFDFRRNPIAIQALPCTNAPVTNQRKKSKSFSTATKPDSNKSHLSEVQCRKSSTKNILLSPSRDVVKTLRKCKKRRSCLRAGPENEECAPSDKNFLGKRRHFYTANDWDNGTDVARIAAKALVLLSAAEPSYNSLENPLHWFAEIASDVDFSTEGFQTSMFYNLDDFETMTLRLEDTSKEDSYCHSVIANQDEKVSLVTTVPCRATRARGKRSKKLKNFQGVILPGISSLSKHEVTEDLHFIKELMQATGTPNIFVSRNRCSRTRRQSTNTASNTSETSPCFPSHLQNGGKRMMTDWGNITRRRRGQRYPARRLTFILEAHTLKAH